MTQRRTATRRRAERSITKKLAVIAALWSVTAVLVRSRGVSQTDGLRVAPPPIGSVANGSTVSGPPADVLGRPPQLVSVATAQAALPARIERLRARYETWFSTRVPAPRGDELPELPPDVTLPPAPDAPDAQVVLDLDGGAR